MSDSKAKYYTLGTVMQAKSEDGEPKRFYLKCKQSTDKTGKPYGEKIFPITLANGIVINDGDILSMYDVKEKFSRLVDEGKMDAEQARELSYLKYDVVLRREEGSSSSPSKKKSDIEF